MPVTLVHPDIVRKWEKAYAGGSDKRYPSLDLVRLELWFFEHKPGRLLEYAFGSGVNTIHLAECGHQIDGVDASRGAKELVARKLAARPDIAGRVRLAHISPEETALAYPDGSFDYVVCMSLLSLLASKQRVEHLLAEFVRVMKPGAKIILDVNGPNADFARNSERIGDDVYAYRGASGRDEPVPTYCPDTAEKFADVVRPYFAIDELGYTAFKYLHSEITEFIICAHKPDSESAG